MAVLCLKRLSSACKTKSVIYTRTTKSPEISTISGLLLYLFISRNCILDVNLVLFIALLVKRILVQLWEGRKRFKIGTFVM